MSTTQADALHDRYRKAFVGRARATRDLALLDAIIAEAERLPSSPAVAERLTLYRAERTEIAAIQAGGPAMLAAWRVVEWSDVSFSRYLREFAGQPRPTRDLGLLGEMAAELRGWIAALPKKGDARLTGQRTQMEANLALFAKELEAIPVARAALAPSEQARVLATAANRQFALYRSHFEGKSRASRRPALLERLIGALEAIHASMLTVRELGVRTDAHEGNITRVADRIAHHRGELAKVREARTQVTTAQLARSLGDEANKLFAVYRAEFSGKPRASCDPARLSEICDSLHEIARAMQALEAERPDATNARNIGVVLDHLKMAEREFAAVREARNKPA